jgi:uncharacterized coiled-coil protein SlyX
MTEENRLKSIEKKIDEQGKEIKVISDTLSIIAVQKERIKHVEAQQTALWKKYDMLVSPDTGPLQRLMKHQASCPRDQIKFLWWFVGTVNFGLLVAILALLMRGYI